MKNQGKITLLSILACASMLSVGFSAWQINAGDQDSVTGTIYVDEITTKSYLKQTITRKFEYSIEGYTEQYYDGYYAIKYHNNIMRTHFEIDREECIEEFNASKIELQVRLSYSDAALENVEDIEDYYDFFADASLSSPYGYLTSGYDSSNGNNYILAVEGYEEGIKNEELIMREALLEQGIYQFTYVIYDEENPSLVVDDLYLEYISRIDENHDLYEKYFTKESLETSPLFYNAELFKFTSTLIIETGGES